MLLSSSDYNKGVLTKDLIKKIIKIARRYRKILIIDPKKKDFFQSTAALHL